MRLVETWVATPLAGAAGWTLIHSLWEGAILACALALVMATMRSPRARYIAACLAMLAMLVGFALTFAHMIAAAHGTRIAATPPFPAWNARTGANASGSWNPGFAAAVPWLTPFWIAGVWIFTLRHLAGWISVTRLRRRGVCYAPNLWQQRLADLAARLRVSRPVLLLESCVAEVPMVLGHFRPLILVPVGLLAGLPAEQVEAILLHELAHVRRCDYLVNLLQRSVESLFFYHPAIWWISHVIRAERENCCDDVVVALSGNVPEYAAALAALEQKRCAESAVAATGGSLVKRIHRLLYPKTSHRAWTPWIAAVILIATAAVAMAAWQSEPVPQNSAAVASPYLRWLNQEVVYIINDQERAAFLRLTTNAERDMFIEQFWLRRDPTPGTPQNEFQDEHYRRIAFANDRFGTASGRPGWQTDRGHIYIVYGPPDQIEDHTAPSPIEVWMYRHVEGIGDNVSVTFIDRTGARDYRLAPGNPK